MDTTELLLAAAVRDRAISLKQSSREAFFKLRNAHGGPTEHDWKKWEMDNSDTKFFAEAFVELETIAAFLATLRPRM